MLHSIQQDNPTIQCYYCSIEEKDVEWDKIPVLSIFLAPRSHNSAGYMVRNNLKNVSREIQYLLGNGVEFPWYRYALHQARIAVQQVYNISCKEW